MSDKIKIGDTYTVEISTIAIDACLAVTNISRTFTATDFASPPEVHQCNTSTSPAVAEPAPTVMAKNRVFNFMIFLRCTNGLAVKRGQWIYTHWVRSVKHRLMI